MMKLVDLDPEWVTTASAGAISRFSDTHSHVTYAADEDGFVDAPARSLDLPNADGVLFLCPTCFTRNGSAIGTESVLCWFSGRGVPDAALPGPGRWTASGTSFADLSLSPSVNVDHGHWHGFIRNGEVT